MAIIVINLIYFHFSSLFTIHLSQRYIFLDSDSIELTTQRMEIERPVIPLFQEVLGRGDISSCIQNFDELNSYADEISTIITSGNNNLLLLHRVYLIIYRIII